VLLNKEADRTISLSPSSHVKAQMS